MQSDRL